MSASRLETEDKVTKFYLYLCQRGSKPAPTYISGPRPSPIRSWLHRPLWTGRFWCVQATCISKRMLAPCHQHTYLYLAFPTSMFDMFIWVNSYVSRCSAICNWNKVDSVLLSTAVSIFSTRTATFDTGTRAECAGNERGSKLHLTTSIVKSNCAFSSKWSVFPHDGVMHNAPHYSYLQALAVHCAVLSPLWPLRACSVFPVPAWLYSTKICVDKYRLLQSRRIGHAW